MRMVFIHNIRFGLRHRQFLGRILTQQLVKVLWAIASIPALIILMPIAITGATADLIAAFADKAQNVAIKAVRPLTIASVKLDEIYKSMDGRIRQDISNQRLMQHQIAEDSAPASQEGGEA